MRRMAADFQGQFMDAMREADVEEIKADVGKLAESAKVDVALQSACATSKARSPAPSRASAKTPSAGIGAEAPTCRRLTRRTAVEFGRPAAFAGSGRGEERNPSATPEPRPSARSGPGRAGAASRRDRGRDEGAGRRARGGDGEDCAAAPGDRRGNSRKIKLTFPAPRF